MAAIRVLHCPANVGGHPMGLARAERELGLDSVVVAFHEPPYGYEVDEVLFPAGTGRLSRERLRLAFLRRAASEFDVVHFNFGSSILPRPAPPRSGANTALHSLSDLYARLVELRDVPLLARRGTAVVVTFQGDDARHGRAWRERLAGEVGPDYYHAARDGYRRRAIDAFDRHAQRIYALNPDLLGVLPTRAEFLPYANVDPRARPVLERRKRNGRPVIVHAPTDRNVKGTRYVVAAVEKLRAEGVELELHLVEGRSHADALAAYARADLCVDQLLIGWYGGVAVEAMALETPVVAHVREQDLRFVPEAMRGELPVIDAQPDTLAAVLREWLTVRRDELPALGARGRAYVERWHDPRRIAERLKADYEAALAGQPPPPRR